MILTTFLLIAFLIGFAIGSVVGVCLVLFHSKRFQWTVFVSNNEEHEKKVVATIHQLNTKR